MGDFVRLPSVNHLPARAILIVKGKGDDVVLIIR